MRNRTRIKDVIGKMARGGKAPSILPALLMLFSVAVVGLDAGRAEAFSGGNGSAAAPWQIATAADLNEVRNYLGDHFILTADIDLTDYLNETGAGYNSGAGWVPIGTYQDDGFTGSFDGNGYTISNLYINWITDASENPVGLFGFAWGAEIKNVTLTDINVNVTGSDYADLGGLVGNPYQTSIASSSVAGRVYYDHTGDWYGYAGGLAGYSNQSGIAFSSSDVEVVVTGTGWVWTGGLVGQNDGGTIYKSYAEGNVDGDNWTGGLVGMNYGRIEESYATGDVSATLYGSDCGGLVGGNYGSIFNSYATGIVTAGYSAGGLAGYNSGTIVNTYAAIGVVTGTVNTGGLVGNNESWGTIIASYFDDANTDNGAGLLRSAGAMTYPYDASKDTYVGWDFDNIWALESGVNSNYPFLRTQALFAGGTGMALDPWQIATDDQLHNVRTYLGEYYHEKHFILTADIDLSAYGASYNDGKGWEPIGNWWGNGISTYFTGTFDGNGHTISNLFIDQPGDTDYEAIGLFGSTYGATIANVHLADVDVTGYWGVGGLVGEAYCSGDYFSCNASISGSSVSGTVTGDSSVGGLVGSVANQTLSVSGSSVSGTVTGGSSVGGLIGDNYGGTIISSYATATVTAPWGAVGGLVGSNDGVIEDCYATGGIVSESDYVGGLVGWHSDGTIRYSYATGSVTGAGWVGGLVGYFGRGMVEYSYAAGAVNGNQQVGGLAGYSGRDAVISNTYALGSVTSDELVGGLVGVNTGTIQYSYAIGVVTATVLDAWRVGGLVGQNSGLITSSYFSDDSDNGAGTYTSVEDMKLQATYVNWDFAETWAIEEGVNPPYLQWETMEKIWTAEDLDNVRNDLAGRYMLMADIDLSVYGSGYDSGQGWLPIGDSSVYFTGTFNGKGHSISNLYINRTGPSEVEVGLFGRVSEATISNVTLLNVDVTGYQAEGFTAVGSLVGLIMQGTTKETIISGSKATGVVQGNMNVGGLVGRNDFGTITGSHAAVNVFGDSGVQKVGGLVGDNNGGTISDSFAIGDVLGGSNSSELGGLVGITAGGTIENSYATGAVTGVRYVGGLAGKNHENEIRHSYATGTVTGERYIGGLVGTNNYANDGSQPYAIVRNVYAKGAVFGDQYVGGLVGSNRGSYAFIERSYAVGAVAGTLDVGGLVGENVYGASVTDSYYDIFTSLQIDDLGKGIPKTTAEMQQEATFIGWDFAADWNIATSFNDGYPFLRCQGVTIIDYVAGTGGTVNPIDEALEDPTGTALGSTATADPGYFFVNWTDAIGNIMSVDAYFSPAKVNGRYEEATYYANFIPAGDYRVSVTIDPPGSGTVKGDGYYYSGDTVTLTASAAVGYKFVKWTEDGKKVSNKATYSFRIGTADRYLTAHFALAATQTYLVTVSANPEAGGTVGGGGYFQAGDSVTVNAAANAGYTFIHWTEGSTVVSDRASYTFTMGAADRDLYANFQEEGYGWPTGIRVKATTVTSTTVTLTLSEEVPGAVGYTVYYDGGSAYFDASSLNLTINSLTSSTQYTFTVQAVYVGDRETLDGPSVKVRTKK